MGLLNRILGREASAVEIDRVVEAAQRVVAGVGNIYASEALWRARLSPLVAAPVSHLLGAPVATVFGATGRLARENATLATSLSGLQGRLDLLEDTLSAIADAAGVLRVIGL